ncbi:MAG: carboxylesterase, partial [Alphaproteobacteria bacterium]|nr:carboxylesterase [Alphaproteobacteria bacterium]
MIGSILGVLFGGGRNVVQQTAEVFRPNAEREAQRGADYQSAALQQFGAEFYQRRGLFDRIIDGLNRLPRPAMALGVLFLLGSAMTDPVWFASRMQGLTLVPDPLWWLLGAVVSFYFGSRYQAKGQDFQKSLAATMARVPQVISNIKKLRSMRFDSPGVADTGTDAEVAISAVVPESNQAVEDWKAS